jgi:hypothetical protein
MKTVNFVYKGDRNYIQGSSIFNSIVNSIIEKGFFSGELSVSFKKIITTSTCVLEFRPNNDQDACVARFKGSDYKNFQELCINPLKNDNLIRVPFKEEEVCKNSMIIELNITQVSPSHDDVIELVISLCKKIHIEKISSEKKWIFCGYKGKFPIPKPNKIISLDVKKIIGNRMTWSDFYVDNEFIGSINFIKL